ncbi:hypothetical protein [Colwellia psychrerythraea]|uniref:Uncharacterized protein n=1 Tax=Colwellia psychrerythraea (strain 34H / ATCC BAA-681) TaxID=167879 RepID=Q47U90_COLP3|nr:hypothetical protein [Colwellia psychrerythraea]AAZ24884.1 hypothetical protein CPS_4994 [Colwellia psychrerythraea 34H]
MNDIDNRWYTEPQKKYANYVTNVVLLTQKGYSSNKPFTMVIRPFSSGLSTIYMTGDKQWLNKANTLTDLYQKNIDDGGKFKLKKSFDVKSLMPKGLLYRYLFSGDVQAISTLVKI